MSPSQLASACFVTCGAITQRVERAAKAGLVTRLTGPSGYHSHAITLTDKGNEVVERAVGRLLRHEQELVDHLPPAKQAVLAALLRELLEALTDRMEVAATSPGHVGETGL